MDPTRPAKRKLINGQMDSPNRADANFVYDSPLPSKRPKHEENNSLSDYAPSTVPSLAATATATVADTTAPMTDSSGQSRTKPRVKKFGCTFPGCDKAFDRPIRLQVHYNTHTGERPHSCIHVGCDKSFFKSSHLKAHIQEKHIDQRSYICAFLVHSADIGSTVPCGRAFPTSTKLKRHVAQHEEKEETTCSWDSCGKVFRKQETLQRHIKKDHLNELPYLCTHETADGGACGQSFATPGMLKGHVAHQHSSTRYWCNICTADNAPEAGTSVISNDLDDAFLPTTDDLRENAESNLFDALSLDDPLPQISADGRVSFATFSELQLHSRLVHPPTCSECGKQCRSNKDLTAHIDIHHTARGQVSKDEVRVFLCPIKECQRAQPDNGFSRKGNLDVHIKTVHAKARTFVCGEHDLAGNNKVTGWNGIGCRVALGTKQALISHIRTQHLGLQAGTGVNTGLQKSAMSKKGRPRKSVPTTGDSFMDVDPVLRPSSAAGNTLAMLTGAGYEHLRPIACLLAGPGGCQVRFTREWDLATHLELTHGWQVDDIQDALSSGVASLTCVSNSGLENSRSTLIGSAPSQQMDTCEDSALMNTLDPQLRGMVA